MTVPLLARPFSLLLLLPLLLVAGTTLAQSAPRVELASVNREPIYQELNLVGTVNSLEDALLSSSVAGLVAAINVNPGDRVEAGDTLVALDDDLARFELAGAQAAEEEARAALSEAQRLLREAES
ncbi:MAG TPA: efflux RND transporter periplasmic adaptor subunit, partial [Halomonas sp.]|nr:efflux RND transporter periplasmic adaptor subunit [Halomonas sp.]